MISISSYLDELPGEILHQNDIRRVIGDERHDFFTTFGPMRTEPAGTELFRQGAMPREAYFIEQGMIKLIHLTEGGQGLIVGLRFPGWLLGAESIILRRPYPVTATVLNECRFRAITAESIISLMNADAKFSWYLQQVHSCEVYDQFDRLVGLGCFSARNRLEKLLWQLISTQQVDNLSDEVRLRLPLKHWEIAQLIAVTPQHLSLILKQMQKEGIIRREKGWVTVFKRHLQACLSGYRDESQYEMIGPALL